MGVLMQRLSLTLTLSLGLILASGPVAAAIPAPEVRQTERVGSEDGQVGEEAKLCHSTKEYIKALEYLREKHELGINETGMRRAAQGVARGCDGAADRFRLVLDHLFEMGVQVGRAIDLAVTLSQAHPDAAKNFVSILKHAYLREYFDYSFARALELAYDFALTAAQQPEHLQVDFEQMVEFCQSQRSLDLPIQVCAELGIEVAKQSAYFPGGVFSPFQSFYEMLRKEPYGLPLNQALTLALQVIRFGPRAPDNFSEAFTFARNEAGGLSLAPKEALRFALSMAEQSVTALPPPRAKSSDAPEAQQSTPRSRQDRQRRR